MEATIQGDGEKKTVEKVNQSASVYIGEKYVGKTVEIAVEVQE